MCTATTSISYENVLKAYERIKPFVHCTPVLTSASLNEMTKGKELFFKAELLQKTGSFKARGATNAVLLAKEEGILKAVSTHSSGNHAQALAWAARMAGFDANIVMPNNCPSVKRSAVVGYGAKVFTCEPTLQAREDTAKRVTEETGSLFVHPYENLNVICGQGTIAVELLNQVPELDAIIVPIGGGGLISGISTAAKSIKPDIKIIGVEPLNANDAQMSKQSRTLIKHITTPVTIADGLRTSLGENTWPIVRDLVDDIFVASEDEIVRGMFLVWQRMKLIIEPSAAVGVAVALSKEFGDKYEQIRKVGIILCGGNVDFFEAVRLFENQLSDPVLHSP